MEIWKPLRNFPSYNGSSEGRIINVRTQKIQKPFIDKRGRLKVSLYKNNKRYNVKPHRILAETFFGDHPGMMVRHRDGDRTNNRIDNLEWCTNSELLKDIHIRRRKRGS